MKQLFTRISLIGLGILIGLLALPESGSAAHIVGGELTYECLGGGDYEFTMRVYRDCNCTNCANFDPNAVFSIFVCNGSDCNSLIQGSSLYDFTAPLLTVQEVEAPDYPCLIPPNVCVQEGLYRFRLSDYGILLPPGNVTYHVTYQRCCRNITITNLLDPSNTGSTYTVEINPEAQASCNSSPTFNEFPPTIICGGLPFSFDHSATDPDGDSLVYSFCSPLVGGGPSTNPELLNTCFGALPNPACPPPYGLVRFREPAYSPGEPLGGDPVVRIDPSTGMITGTPEVLGQFVVGVCVEEYRNGQLIGKVFRDFQFNVANCDPTIVARIQSDTSLGGKSFVVNSCGNNVIQFENESFQRQFVESIAWSFGIGSDTLVNSNWEPQITFPGIGQYTGQLVLNEGTLCADTADITVNIFPEVRADYAFDYDTCRPGPVFFEDQSTTGSDTLVAWRWDFGTGEGDSLQNPTYSFRNPGSIPVSLSVTDINGCEAETVREVPYFPIPALLILGPGPYLVCNPADVFFDNLSEPISEEYDIRWEFGDGGTSSVISPTHTYTNPGIYTVSLELTSPLGCRTDTIFNTLVTVLESPVAAFTYEPQNPTILDPEVSFQDESQRAAAWFWSFGNGDNSREQNPVYTYPDTGVYQALQVVTHPNGCTDTTAARIDIRPEVRFFLPNAFTPNGDGLNEEYKGEGIMEGATDFEMTIWSRWGQLMFKTTDPDQGWNGKERNTGREAPNDVYVVRVNYLDPRGNPVELQGFATVVR